MGGYNRNQKENRELKAESVYKQLPFSTLNLLVMCLLVNLRFLENFVKIQPHIYSCNLEKLKSVTELAATTHQEVI